MKHYKIVSSSDVDRLEDLDDVQYVYSNVNFTELMKKLVFLDKIGVINPETGKVEVKEVITFLNKYLVIMLV